MYNHQEGLLNSLPLVLISGRVLRIVEMNHIDEVFSGRYWFRSRRGLPFALEMMIDELG